MRVLILLAVVLSFAWSVIVWLVWRRREVTTKETLVERQVVVTRCGFCSKMRAIDLSVCAHCGAR